MNPKLSYREILALVDSIDPVLYAKTRNHLSGAITKLSPYITRGVINLTVIRDRILTRYSYAESEKFIQELAWREYFGKVFTAKGDAIFSDLRFPRTNWQHNNLVSALVASTTGITAVDAELRNLFATGYMHNHARLWTAMIGCNVGRADWYNLSRFLYYHLLDGDLASNTLSWQWVAGTSASKPYLANQSIINACSDFTQSDTYLDRVKEEIGVGIIPKELVASEPFTYKMSYPASDTLLLFGTDPVFLYHPWSLDPLWHEGEFGARILVIEQRLFDAYPISPLVLEHLLTTARTHIPDIKVYVGAVETIPGLATVKQVYVKEHPTVTHFPGVHEKSHELFPEVTGYYPSFFTFWQACLKASGKV